MDANMVLALGLGMRPPWRLVGQRLDTGKQPHELHLDVSAERGSLFACPACGKACKAHDFQGPCSRISQRHNLRDHDLHDRRAPGRLVSIHLKRRRTVSSSGARVEFVLDPLDIGIGQNREVGTFWEVLPEEAVSVFVEAAFPRVIGLGKIG